MIVSFGFDVSAISYANIEIENDEIEGMTEEEILEYAINSYEDKAYYLAEKNCEFDLGILDIVSFNGKEYRVD